MSLLLDSLDFLLHRMDICKAGSLDRLPNDVLVDHIFVHLEVKEILRLRRVSKLYYYLTQHPSIWKRLLRRIDYPLPPLPPTSRHSLNGLSSLEVERLLTRPLTLDKTWQESVPDCFDEWKFHAHHRIKSMVILPGGQYLVASVSDPSDKCYALMVFMLDHPYGLAVPLAKTATGTKAYSLQAKYMSVKGRRGITISYVCRDFRHKSDAKKGIDISQYSGEYEVDPPVPLIYECRVLHIALSSLEALGDPRFIPGSQEFLEHAKSQPPPFRRLAVIRSTRSLGPATLDEVFGTPYIALVRRPNTIMFKDLDGGAVSTLTPRPAEAQLQDCPHSIMAIRMLPIQNQILVIRRVGNVPPDRHSQDVFPVETYHIPINLTREILDEEATALDRVFILDDVLSQVYITDHYHPAHDDDSLQRHILGTHSQAPRPISIIASTVKPEGMIRCTIYPEKVDQWFPPTPTASSSSSSSSRSSSPASTKREDKYMYNISECSPIRYIQAPADTQYRILPGSYRSIVCTVPNSDITDSPKIKAMKRYWDEECLRRPTPEQLEDQTYLDAPRKPFRQFAWDMKDVGISSMAWDETIGRLCMVVEESPIVWVLDFAKAPREDHFGRRLPLCLDRAYDESPPTQPVDL